MDEKKLFDSKRKFKQIEDKKEQLADLESAKKAYVNNSFQCFLTACGRPTQVDVDIFEIAMILHEKRRQGELEKLQSEFEAL